MKKSRGRKGREGDEKEKDKKETEKEGGREREMGWLNELGQVLLSIGLNVCVIK